VALALELSGDGPPADERSHGEARCCPNAARERAFAAYRSGAEHEALLRSLGRCTGAQLHDQLPDLLLPECIFRTPTFEHDSELFYQWAERNGRVRMLPDTLLFHLTRLNTW